ncbi:MAG: formimidoylglutamase, partial [Gammaproteobacteria bacterium]
MKSILTPTNPTLWNGRADSLPNERFFQRVICAELEQYCKQPLKSSPSFVLLGFSSDAGIVRNLGRQGAKDGPDHLRQALGRLAIPIQFTAPIHDIGNLICENDKLEEAQKNLGAVVDKLLKHGSSPIIFGGGHEIAWGHYQGIASAYPNKRLGIINFDAHFDLRPLLASNKGTSGTPFRQIAEHRKSLNQSFDYLCIGIQPLANTQSLFETANELNVKMIFAEQINQLEYCKKMIDGFIKDQDIIYLTLCLDVFNQSVA